MIDYIALNGATIQVVANTFESAPKYNRKTMRYNIHMIKYNEMVSTLCNRYGVPREYFSTKLWRINDRFGISVSLISYTTFYFTFYDYTIKYYDDRNRLREFYTKNIVLLPDIILELPLIDQEFFIFNLDIFNINRVNNGR